jgi:hypothetical protein
MTTEADTAEEGVLRSHSQLINSNLGGMPLAFSRTADAEQLFDFTAKLTERRRCLSRLLYVED